MVKQGPIRPELIQVQRELIISNENEDVTIAIVIAIKVIVN